MTAVKIEKLNDFQIRCTLTAEDLKENHVGITDIAFCSDKAKSLFRDMMQHASDEFGFDLSSTASLFVEMRATSPEDLVLTITRIKDAADIRRFMSGFGAGAFGGPGGFAENLSEDERKARMEKYKNFLDKTFRPSGPGEENSPAIRSFRFDSLDDVISAAREVGAGFGGINSLFRFGSGSNFQLLIHLEKENEEEFNRVCDALSEYGLALTCTAATENYLKEHGGLILENNALQQLAYL